MPKKVRASFKFVGPWDKFRSIIDPDGFRRRVRRNVGKASHLNAKLVERKMRNTIQNGEFDANKPLTIALKKSSKPLVGKGGDLFRSITSVKVGDFDYFIGVLRTNDVYNVAVTVHDGKTISVTPKMRGMFFALYLASQGRISADGLGKRAQELFKDYQDWRPLKPSTTHIRIGPRKFVDQTFDDPKMKKRIAENWRRAIDLAFKQKA